MNICRPNAWTPAGATTQSSDAEQGVDFVAIARAFGWGASRVARRDALDEGLAECLDSKEPYLLEALFESESESSILSVRE